MVIKQLHIQNFRCFKDFQIEFGERATIIFGKNGSGKTSLLDAVREELSVKQTSQSIKAPDKSTCYSDEGCLKVWLERLVGDLINIRQNNERLLELNSQSDNDEDSGKENIELIHRTQEEIFQCEHEVKAIESCLVIFSQSLSSSILDEDTLTIEAIGLHSDFPNLCVRTTAGDEVIFNHLPSSYKRLFSIVLDLAFRSYLVSRGKMNNNPGIAIIDDIDLHLYPDLESVVLPIFLEAFPHTQFIVSSNSPHVLSSISTTDGKTKILKLVKGLDEPAEYKDLYGLDTNSIQQEIMGIKPNAQELERMLDQCAYMRWKGLEEQANNLESYAADRSQISPKEITRRVNQKLNTLKNN